jgi:hypothetical protein
LWNFLRLTNLIQNKIWYVFSMTLLCIKFFFFFFFFFCQWLAGILQQQYQIVGCYGTKWLQLYWGGADLNREHSFLHRS